MKPHTTPKIKWLTASSLIAALAASGPALAANDSSAYSQDKATQSQQASANETKWYNPTTWFNDDADSRDNYAQGSDNEQGVDWKFWDDEDSWQEDYNQSNQTADNSSIQSSTNYTWNEETKEWESNQGVAGSSDRYSAESYSAINADQSQEQTLSGKIEGFRTMTLQASASQQGDRQGQQQRASQEHASQSRAQQDSQRQAQGQSGQQDQQGRQAQQGQQGQRELVVSKIKLDSGENLVVSLGEKKDIEHLQLEKGAEVQLTGIPGQIDNQPIFIVTELEANDQSVALNRVIADPSLQGVQTVSMNDRSSSMQRSQSASNERNTGMNRTQSASARDQNLRSQSNQSASQSSQSASVANRESGLQNDSQSQSARGSASDQDAARSGALSSDSRTQQDLGYSQTRDRSLSREAQASQDQDAMNQRARKDVSGKVERIESAEIEGSDQGSEFVSLHLEDGQKVTVGLGQNASADDLELESGDEVRVVGQNKQIQGQDVLQAEAIWINGEQPEAVTFQRY